MHGAESLAKLVRCGPALVAVVFHVALGRFGRMMLGVLMMPMRGVRVMRRGFMIARLVVIRRVPMMLRRVLVVLGCLAMMFCRLLGHGSS